MSTSDSLVTRLLLHWYDEHKRTLPWRGAHDPYAIWVSETMLQQTRVETVLSYYPRFLDRFPTVQALADAPLDDVLKLWEGLGYYRRAQNLHKGAQQVVNDFGGKLPQSTEQLMKIHGIGEYTAGAIASIAFSLPVPAVDGNVIRVVSRLCGIRENVGIPSVHRALKESASLLVSSTRPGDFNQAMMDLGSAICTPGTPDCEACPLRDHCDAFREGDAELLPVLPKKNPPREIDYDLLLICSESGVLVRQRTETMLQGLWCFPMLEGHHTTAALPGAVKRRLGLKVGNVSYLEDARHIFTHQVWKMKIYLLETSETTPPEGWCFVSANGLSQLSMPTAIVKARRAAIKFLSE